MPLTLNSIANPQYVYCTTIVSRRYSHETDQRVLSRESSFAMSFNDANTFAEDDLFKFLTSDERNQIQQYRDITGEPLQDAFEMLDKCG